MSNVSKLILNVSKLMSNLRELMFDVSKYRKEKLDYEILYFNGFYVCLYIFVL